MESLKVTLEAEHKQQKTRKPPRVHLCERAPPQSSHSACKTEDVIYNSYLAGTALIEANCFDEMLVSCSWNTIPNQRIFGTLTPQLPL